MQLCVGFKKGNRLSRIEVTADASQGNSVERPPSGVDMVEARASHRHRNRKAI